MSKWKIQYLQRPVSGVATHGIIRFVEPSGKIFFALEGRPTENGKPTDRPTTNANIQVYSSDGVEKPFPRHDATFHTRDLFEGSQQEVWDRLRAAITAAKLINDKNIGYPLAGTRETNRTRGISNSNSVISTLARVMRIDKEPVPGLPPGGDREPAPVRSDGHRHILLDRDEINAIRERYRLAPTLEQLESSLDPDNQPLKPRRSDAVDPLGPRYAGYQPERGADGLPVGSTTAFQPDDIGAKPPLGAQNGRRAEIESELRKPRIESAYWRDPAIQDEYRALLEQGENRASHFPLPDDAARKTELEEEMRKGRNGEYFRRGSVLPREYLAILKRESGVADENTLA